MSHCENAFGGLGHFLGVVEFLGRLIVGSSKIMILLLRLFFALLFAYSYSLLIPLRSPSKRQSTTYEESQ